VNRPRSRRILGAAGASALAVLALVLLPALPAAAASNDGWVRLAHLSPDTKAVNITLSSLSGDVTLFKLKNVGYGAVSNYMRLPQGTYALAMVPSSNTDPNATPIVSGSVQVTSGKAETVAALGMNKNLKTKVISDDLNQSTGKGAAVRVVQASVKHDTVSVSAGSKDVASDVAFGDVSSYAKIPAGSATLSLKAGDVSDTADQTFAAGTIHTVFVLDKADGGLTVASALDSSASAATPIGSIDTGGGALAGGNGAPAAALAGAAAAGGVAFAVVALRRRPQTQRA
jgi:hypothetical protein